MDGIDGLAPIHHPPAGMMMSELWQPVMTYAQVVPVLVVVWLAFRRWLPKEPGLVVACLVGGGVATLLEPMVEHLALVWFAPGGMWEMFRAFGRPMPWFILPCYVWYVGGQTMLTLAVLRRGIDTRRLFLLYGAYVLSNIVMEVPAIAAGIYVYYGPQPFEIAGLPLWFQSINAASPIVAAAAIHRLGSRPGWHPVMAVAVIPGAHALSNATAGWPMWAALNSTSSLVVTHATGLVTIGLAVLLTYLVALVVTEPRAAAVRDAATLGEVGRGDRAADA